MPAERSALFSDVPVRKAVLTLAVPTVISQLITVVYNMADTFFIGQLNDPLQVAATTLAMPCFMFLTAFANLFGLGGSSLISRCLGSDEREKSAPHRRVLHLDGSCSRVSLRRRHSAVGAGAVPRSRRKGGNMGLSPAVCFLDDRSRSCPHGDERRVCALNSLRGVFQTGRLRCSTGRCAEYRPSTRCLSLRSG